MPGALVEPAHLFVRVAREILHGQPSSFRGYADPSIRQDPLSGRLWMAYSWPNVHITAESQLVPGVDIHLAYSDDGGEHWIYSQALWPSLDNTIHNSFQEPGYTDHEVANILPRVTENGVIWYGARLDYFVPNQGGFRRRPVSSFRWVIMQAASPQELATAVGITAQGKFLAEDSDILLFATKPDGDIEAWQWRYVGKLAGSTEARELGGCGLTQVELARGVDGQLLAIFTPDDWDSKMREIVHYGCRVVEIESLDPPKLARDSSGNLIVRSEIVASDQMPLGPGACGYDPASSTGILFVKREKNEFSFSASIHRTFIRP